MNRLGQVQDAKSLHTDNEDSDSSLRWTPISEGPLPHIAVHMITFSPIFQLPE